MFTIFPFPVRFLQWHVAIGWILCLTLLAVVSILPYVLEEKPLHPSAPHALYSGTHRSLWALALTWIIVACEEGYGGKRQHCHISSTATVCQILHLSFLPIVGSSFKVLCLPLRIILLRIFPSTCCLFVAGFVSRFLSWEFWTPLSNISFASYLVHPPIIVLHLCLQETSISYSDINFVSI